MTTAVICDTLAVLAAGSSATALCRKALEPLVVVLQNQAPARPNIAALTHKQRTCCPLQQSTWLQSSQDCSCRNNAAAGSQPRSLMYRDSRYCNSSANNTATKLTYLRCRCYAVAAPAGLSPAALCTGAVHPLQLAGRGCGRTLGGGASAAGTTVCRAVAAAVTACGQAGHRSCLELLGLSVVANARHGQDTSEAM